MRRPDGAVAPARNPQFRRFWLGQSVSLLGDQVSVIAVPLVAVLTLDASAAQMGYLVAAELAPNLLFSHTRSTHSRSLTCSSWRS